jgi:hypothetical protein
MAVSRTVRNIAIIAILAAIVDVVPGGGTGANVVGQAVSLLFLGAIAWFLSIMYRQNRYTLDSLGERRRAILYVAIGIAAVTLTATHRLWQTPGGSVAWLVLMGAVVYALVSVVVAARR